MNQAKGSDARILVAQSGFLGDVVLTTPVLAALRRCYPRARLVMLVTPTAAPLVAHHPAVDRVIVDDKRRSTRGLAGWARLAGMLRAERFTIAIAAHKSFRTGLLLRAAGIARRVGFGHVPGAALYTERVPRPRALHDRDRILELLRPLGAYPEAHTERRPWVAFDARAGERAAALLAPLRGERRPLAGICPGSAWPTKCWPARAYGRLVRMLETGGYRCVLLGGPEEHAVTAAVAQAAGGLGLDLGGRTDIATFAAVLTRMAVVVSNDSAPMHLAAAADVPQVAIFCATVPAQGYGPVGSRAVVVEKDLACRPCGRHGGRRCPRGTHDCGELVEPDEVRAAVERVRALAA